MVCGAVGCTRQECEVLEVQVNVQLRRDREGTSKAGVWGSAPQTLMSSCALEKYPSYPRLIIFCRLLPSKFPYRMNNLQAILYGHRPSYYSADRPRPPHPLAQFDLLSGGSGNARHQAYSSARVLHNAAHCVRSGSGSGAIRSQWGARRRGDIFRLLFTCHACCFAALNLDTRNALTLTFC